MASCDGSERSERPVAHPQREGCVCHTLAGSGEEEGPATAPQRRRSIGATCDVQHTPREVYIYVDARLMRNGSLDPQQQAPQGRLVRMKTDISIVSSMEQQILALKPEQRALSGNSSRNSAIPPNVGVPVCTT